MLYVWHNTRRTFVMRFNSLLNTKFKPSIAVGAMWGSILTFTMIVQVVQAQFVFLESYAGRKVTWQKRFCDLCTNLFFLLWMMWWCKYHRIVTFSVRKKHKYYLSCNMCIHLYIHSMYYFRVIIIIKRRHTTIEFLFYLHSTR